MSSHCAGHGTVHNTKHWSYEGQTGPEHWGQLNAEFVHCRIGKQQSPVDIASWQHSCQLTPLRFHYACVPLRMTHDGHALLAQLENDAGFVAVGAVQYKLLQFHFHTPGEHRVQGESYAMEIHLVHQNNQGQLLVVAVLVRQHQAHPALMQLFKQLPTQAGGAGPSLLFDATGLLPQQQGYFHYQGSLTTPPCTQDVQWYVMTQPVEADKQQIDKLLQSMGGKPNSRPVQPLHGRTVWRADH